MRPVILVLVLCVALTDVGQTSQRPTAPTSTTSGGPGRVNPAPSAQAAQDTDPLNATIRGRVVRADNGQPIEGARVSINAVTVSAVSDIDGRFELTKLRAGTYSPTAYANGFPRLPFGSRRLGDAGRSIALEPGQVVNGVDFALPRGAVLSGVLLDERGQPLALAPVWVLRQQFIEGHRRLMRATDSDPTSGVETGFDLTDDFGRFRIFGLRQGTYYLAGRQPDAGLIGAGTMGSYDLSTPTALYPGDSIAEAQPLTVSTGQELSGLAFALRPIRTANITVVLSSRNGPFAGNFSYEQVGGISVPINQPGPDGRYTLGRRLPGTYTFFVRDGDQVAFARVDLNGEDLLVPLSTKRGGTLRGRVVTDVGAPPGPQPADINLSAWLLEPKSNVSVTVKPDLSFEVTGLIGPMRLTASARTGWSTRQLLVGGSDVTGLLLDGSRDITDVEVVLTQAVVELSGMVRDSTGRPAADASVVVFADDADRRWIGSPFLRVARAGADGRFTLRGVPAGRYRAAALEFLESSEATNPDLPAQLDSASTPVTLTHGVPATLDLRLVP